MLKLLLICLSTLLITYPLSAENITIRVGHLPNITHAQALIGNALTYQGKGWFEKFLGDEIKVEWYVYPAGPSAMEALLAEAIDLVYTGPSPTINAFIRSEGKMLKIISGSCSGGAALVIRSDLDIKSSTDFKGKKIATPELGNTQDVSCRSFFKTQGYKVSLTGGDVTVIPIENPEEILLFTQGTIDGAWTIEPWVSRLVLEANGKVFLEESSLWKETMGKYVTTHLVVNASFLQKNKDVTKKWIRAHVELTEWIKNNPDVAKKIIADELKRETSRSFPQNVLMRSFEKIELTHDPIQPSLAQFAKMAYQVGFLKKEPNLEGIYDLTLLETVLKEMQSEMVK